MTHSEILERCAKVMGYELLPQDGGKPHMRRVRINFTDGTFTWGSILWNPLTSVADAADMAIKCRVDVYWQDILGYVQCNYAPSTGDKFISVLAYTKDHPSDQEAYCYVVCSVVSQMYLELVE